MWEKVKVGGFELGSVGKPEKQLLFSLFSLSDNQLSNERPRYVNIRPLATSNLKDFTFQFMSLHTFLFKWI